MSLRFKKTTLSSLLAITISSTSSYAVLLPPNAVVNPNIRGVFLGIDGLYLQPSNNDLDYVTIFPIATTIPVSTQAVSPSYTGGFNLYGGVTFGQNNDITLDWMRLHSSDSASIGNLLSFATVNPRWIDNNLWTSVTGNVDFDLDDVSAVLGHTYYFNNPWSVRFAGGVEYARLNSQFSVTETLSDDGGGTYGYVSNSEFTGVGPRVEGDLFYRLPYNFGLFADTNAALLIGRRDLSLNSVNRVNQSYTLSNRNVVVPAIGMKIGVSYTFLFGQVTAVGAVGAEGVIPMYVTTPTTAVNIAAGWQATSYINSVENPNCIGFVSEGSGAPVGVCTTLTNTISNYSNQGPFLGVKLTTKGF
jgi:hypothetical protein